jgi:hypothetical protein
MAPRTCAASHPGSWADLPPLAPEVATLAARIRTMLSGDPAFRYTVPAEVRKILLYATKARVIPACAGQALLCTQRLVQA